MTCPLTDRELEIVRRIADGMTNAQVGKEIHVSEFTVKTHLARIFAKVDAASRAHLVAIALRRTWIE